MPEAPPPADPLIGRTLGGHYRVEAMIGRGAMGVVYRARHTLLDQPFAVKVLAEGVGADAEVRRRFLLEAKTLTFFTHKHAVQVRHCGEEGGLLYLAMDLVPGETLASLLAREGPLPEARAAAIALQVLDALDEAHRAGIVHRDLKPGNVMVEPAAAGGAPAGERVRVLDFGLARIVDVERAALPGAFASTGGNVVGTVAYMSPEQLRAEEGVDGRSDLFSVGVVLYEMLTGHLPFEGKSTMSIALGILERAPRPLEEVAAPAVSEAMRGVLSRALAKSPGRRFQTAGELSDAIRGALAGTVPPPPPPESVVAPAAAPSARPRRALVAGLGILAALAAGIALLVLRGGSGEGDRAAARAAMLDGRFAEAAEVLGRLVAAGKATPEDRLLRAEARLELADPEAASDLEAARTGLPHDPRVDLAEARLAWRVKSPRDPERAERLLGQALRTDRGFVAARVERVRLRIDGDRMNEALTDLQILEQDPKDSRGPLLRALYDGTRIARKAVPETREAVDALVAETARAEALDPKDADAAEAHANALSYAGLLARGAGDHRRAGELLEASEAAASEAVRRALADRGYRDQGRRLGRYYESRAGQRIQREDHAGAKADFEEVLRRRPDDPEARGHVIFASRFTDPESAKSAAQALHEASGRPEDLFDVAFSLQVQGQEKADAGDSAGAVAVLSRAVERYREGTALSPDYAPFTTYLGETRVQLARLATGKAREDALDAAMKDFQASLRGIAGDSEVYLRRAAAYTLRGDPAHALEDLERAVGDDRGKTPRYYQELARALLAQADVDAANGRPEAARVRIARVAPAIELATARMPSVRPRALPILATAEARAAALSRTPEEKEAHLARARALGKELGAAAATEAQGDRLRAAAALANAEIAHAAGDPAGAVAAAGEAIAIREREHGAGRWSLDGAWLDRLAVYLDAAGKPDEARAARERAAILPR